MNSWWVIGDVHGCAAELDELLGMLPSDAGIAFVGALVGRGPAPVEVLSTLMGLAR
jgi:hypothetical protein